MPLFHIHGLVGALLTSLAGGSIVCTPGFDDDGFFDWVAQFQPSWYTAVPTIHQAIVRWRAVSPQGARAPLPVRALVVGRVAAQDLSRRCEALSARR